jgi:cardiolipin synthase
MTSWIALLLTFAFHFWVVVSILYAERRRPTATLAWILIVVFLPFLGVGLYWWLGVRRTRRVRRRILLGKQRIAAAVDRFDVHERVEQVAGFEIEARTASLLRLARRLTALPPSHGNAVRLLIDARATYEAMLQAIDGARASVHVQFYTIQPDPVGVALRESLVDKARQGVEVRVLYDDVGSFALGPGFWEALTAAGGEAAAFNPVRRWWARWRHRDRLDFRNHRKLLVVDGWIAFTGGVNVGREYLGLDPEVGPWRDTHVRVEGPAALCLQEVFAGDWLTATGRSLDDRRWFPEPLAQAPPGASLVQVIDSGPETLWPPLLHIHNLALALAGVRVWLTTPYFVPGASFEEALVNAALRGVDVCLLLPEKTDWRLVGWAARSYYRPLVEAGVRVFEYQRGFVHAKTLVVDSWLATVGSANMDMRSFQLNFELTAFVLDPVFCDELADQFRRDLEGAREVTLHEVTRRDPRRLLYQTARLLSPLL